MANKKRGEIDAIFDDKPYVLCLTLGALAELESGLGAKDLVDSPNASRKVVSRRRTSFASSAAA